MNVPTVDPTLKHHSPDEILQRLEWRVIRRLDGLMQGDYRTLFYGTGIDFADMRIPGERRHPPHRLERDGGMDSPYVRQFVEDRDVTAWFLLDLSPSMGFGPAARPKQLVLTEYVARWLGCSFAVATGWGRFCTIARWSRRFRRAGSAARSERRLREIARVAASSAVEQAAGVAEAHAAAAIAQLAHLPDSAARDALAALARYVARRRT